MWIFCEVQSNFANQSVRRNIIQNFMENQKHFSQNIEQPKREPKTYVIRFDKSHFGDEEIDPHIVRIQAERNSSWIPQAISEWWSKICSESNLNPNDRRLQNLSYYFIEVARNAFEKVGSGELKVIFEPKRITIVVYDQGGGFGDADDVNYAMAMGHGLSQVKKYADEFSIETNGKKYVKVKGKSKLVESLETDIQQGSKITFIKNFK